VLIVHSCRLKETLHSLERAFIGFRTRVWAMKHRFLTIEPESNARTAPLRTLRPERNQEQRFTEEIGRTKIAAKVRRCFAFISL
jgi:hypothetical protein